MTDEQNLPELRDYPYLHLEIIDVGNGRHLCDDPDDLVLILKAIGKTAEDSYHAAWALNKKEDSLSIQLKILIRAANELLKKIEE